MVKILITGASGYIGQEVALALRRDGHDVTGIVRDAAKGRTLLLNEIRIVVGDLANVENLKKHIDEAHIVVHTAADYANYEKTDTPILDATIEASKHGVQKKRFVYTSGVLVYPGAADTLYNENSPTAPNFKFPVRIKNEQRVVKSSDIVGTVIRPGFVFGKTASHFSKFFDQAEAGKVVVGDDPNITWSKIHLDDLVEAYRLVVNAPAHVVAGEIFNVADDAKDSNYEIAKRFAEVVGYKGEVVVDRSQSLGFLGKSAIVDSRKITSYLGWRPRHVGLLDEVALYYEHHKALNAAK